MSRIESELSAYEFERYRAAEKIEPFGEARADYRAALILFHYISANSKKRPRFSRILKMFDFSDQNESDPDEGLEMMFEQIIRQAK